MVQLENKLYVEDLRVESQDKTMGAIKLDLAQAKMCV